MNSQTESLFASTFLNSFKVNRFCKQLKGDNRRNYLNSALPHCTLFRDEFLQKVPKEDQNVGAIFDILKEKSAPEACYLISPNSSLDGKELPLKEALSHVVGKLMGGTIIICEANRLAYFEGEGDGERFLMLNPKA